MASKFHLSKCYKTVLILLTIFSLAQSFEKMTPPASPSSCCRSVQLENCNVGISIAKCTVNVSVIDNCPMNYSDNTKWKDSCENFNDFDILSNTFLFVPVTNLETNITYWNIYCALCNHENVTKSNFKFWTVQTYHVPEEYTKRILYPEPFVSNVDLAVLGNMKVLLHPTKQLVSDVFKLQHRVIVLRYLPSDLSNTSLKYCSVHEKRVNGSEMMVDNVTLAADAPEHFNCTGGKFCSRRLIPQPGSCSYLNNERLCCKRNEFLVENVDFIYLAEKGRIIRLNGEILHSDRYFALTGDTYRDVIFICDPKDERNVVRKVVGEMEIYAKHISTLFLFAFLLMKTNKKTFKSLPVLVLYSYCWAAFAMYTFHFLSRMIEESTILRMYILIYVFLSQAFWASIISYEYWYIISSSLRVQRSETKMKTYFTYGFVGWILPALLSSLVFPSLTHEHRLARCPSVRDHCNDNMLEHLDGLAYELHLTLILLSVFIFMVLILVVGVQGYFFIRLVRHKRRLGRNCGTRSTSQRDYLFVFTKIAYMMSFHWTLIFITVVVAFSFDFSLAHVITGVAFVLRSCHGTFIFFVFGFSNIRGICKNMGISFKTLGTENTPVQSSKLATVMNKSKGEVV